MLHRWSRFLLAVPFDGAIILKSALTGATELVSQDLFEEADAWMGKSDCQREPALIRKLAGESTAIIVPRELDEHHLWRERLLRARNEEAHIFILHFLPTIQCQLACSYCFENGADRGRGMRSEIAQQSRRWLGEYFSTHPEVDTLRLVFFGGEPLLRKDVVREALKNFRAVAHEHGVEFWCELVTNGELLDEDTARMLSGYSWRRVQITLDGPEEVHNASRAGKSGRRTFRNVMATIEMLTSTDYIPSVDVRISLDTENAERIPELIRGLASLGKQKRMNLSLGIITPTFTSTPTPRDENTLAAKALACWKVASECGFSIPDEFVTGPWCVAIAKHSAVLQPDGSLQKCFCTSGRREYNFGHISTPPQRGQYLKDERFERFRRTDDCIKERCAYLPMCGGGCIHDAVVAAGGPDGSERRFCQKQLLADMNEGLLRLNYGESH